MLYFGFILLICLSLVLFIARRETGRRILLSGVMAGCFFLIVFGGGMVATKEIMGQTITLTATGQQNEASKNSEIWLKEVVVGKKREPARVISGKWILDGGLMGWRNHHMIYQMTDSVKIQLPPSKKLSLVFVGNQWSGIAIASWNGNSQVLDTFIKTEGRNEIILPLELGESGYRHYQRVLITLFAISLMGSIVFGELMSRWCFRNREWIEQKWNFLLLFLKRNSISLGCLLITLASLALMLKYADGRSLWDDDLAQLDLSGKWMTFSQMLNKWLYKEVTNPPFISIVGAIWLRIVPYGTFWVKLLCILFISWGVYLCGMVGKKIGGGRVAIFS